jgi:hypothetical protein
MRRTLPRNLPKPVFDALVQLAKQTPPPRPAKSAPNPIPRKSQSPPPPTPPPPKPPPPIDPNQLTFL